MECGNSGGGNDERIVMGRYRVTRFISDQAHIKSPVFILENKNTTFLWELKRKHCYIKFYDFSIDLLISYILIVYLKS